jgi:IrrE N-terminal-like domain
VSLLVDYKVPFRSEAFIAELAMRCWRIGTVPGSKCVDLKVILTELESHGVESIVQIRGMKRKGRLHIELIDDDAGKSPAYVEFSPKLKMYVRKTVWARFQKGYSKERVIIAHEIGHILLHSDEAKQFSRDPALQIQFADDEDSAEGQANLFADHFLIPTPLGQQIRDGNRLAFVCNVPDGFAFDRLAAIAHNKKTLSVIEGGEACAICGNFGVTFEAGRPQCKSCGSSKGIWNEYGPMADQDCRAD